jgi:cytokinin dehydrogenase
VTDNTYLDWAQRVDVLVDVLRATVSWDDLIKPWFDVWLPESSVERYVGEVVPTLTPFDVGAGGFVLLFPQRRSKLTRRFFRAPKADGGDWVYLFDILTTSQRPGPDPAFTAGMLERNRRLYEKALETGGTRYPIGSIDFSHDDWIAHYGDHWAEFVRLKQRFDPDSILTPGPGIF